MDKKFCLKKVLKEQKLLYLWLIQIVKWFSCYWVKDEHDEHDESELNPKILSNKSNNKYVIQLHFSNFNEALLFVSNKLAKQSMEWLDMKKCYY